MISGGRSERTCKQCRRNNNELNYNCGYLVDESNCDKSIQFNFPELDDLEYVSYICLKWYYNEFNHLYSVLNVYRESKTDLTTLPFGIRNAIRISDSYIEQIKIYNAK